MFSGVLLKNTLATAGWLKWDFRKRSQLSDLEPLWRLSRARFLRIGSLFRVSYTVLWVNISNLSATMKIALYKIEGVPVRGPTVSRRVRLVRLGEYFDLVSHHESTVEADTKLSNDRARLLRSPLALQLIHERLTITTHWHWSYYNNESSIKRIWCLLVLDGITETLGTNFNQTS